VLEHRYVAPFLIASNIPFSVSGKHHPVALLGSGDACGVSLEISWDLRLYAMSAPESW
jgi:hypothetical protein